MSGSGSSGRVTSPPEKPLGGRARRDALWIPVVVVTLAAAGCGRHDPTTRAEQLDERVRVLISRMSLEEKVSQLGHRSPAIPRLDVPQYNWWNEALHGVARAGIATVFPQAIALASTWNPPLIHEIATVISTEARIKFNTERKGLTYWSPTVNLARDPRWGRNEESYGEDPHLQSRIAVAFVRGMQGDDPTFLKTVATPKHFVANNEEGRRHIGSSDVDERNLREHYLPAFQASVTEGRAQSIMCAYNAVNGVPACAHAKLLQGVLRDEWGFEGFVVSDCGAVGDIHGGHRFAASDLEASAAAIAAGTDLNCGSRYQAQLVEAVAKGLVVEAQIDTALHRLLLARFKLGEFEPPGTVPFDAIPASRLDSQAHRDLALRAARESMVLLKNDGILPLDPKTVDSIAVIGPNANRVELGGYSGTASSPVTPLDGIRTRGSALGVAVEYEKGASLRGDHHPLSSRFLKPAGGAERNGLTAEYFNNRTLAGTPVLERIDDTIDFDWGVRSPDPAVVEDGFSVRWSGFLIPPETRTYRLAMSSDDGGRLYLDGELLIEGWEDRETTTDTVSVDLRAGGRYELVMEYYDGLIDAVARLEWDYLDATFPEAVAAAEKADVAVVVVGTDLSVADEERDRADIALPGLQAELIRAVHRANPATVVVLVTGAPLAVNWEDENVPAILNAWYGGQAAGTAIAEILFGDVNPAGRLPQTFHKSVEDLPPFDDYDIIGGGRTYMYFEGDVLYPFGHGLSYTSFEYGELEIRPARIGSSGTVSIWFRVQNTGDLAGDEVAQVYVHDVEASVKTPIRRLERFRRVALSPGESTTVSFSLPVAELSHFDAQTGQFSVEPGQFRVLVGASSQDIRLNGSLIVEP